MTEPATPPLDRQSDAYLAARIADGSFPDPQQPVVRPGPLLFIKYFVGVRLPDRHHTWVLHDTTCQTWAIRAFARYLVMLAPVLVLLAVLLPASAGVRVLCVVTIGGGVVMYLFINILVDNDRRAVRAGYPSGYVADVRSRRANEKHHLGVVARRERSAQRRAQRR